MPELAEVEACRRRWDPGIRHTIRAVELHPAVRIFRGTDTGLLREKLTGARLLSSERRGKWMLFRFSRASWLGIHLGMSGTLRTDEPGGKLLASSFAVTSSRAVTRSKRRGPRARHDHLILRQSRRVLVYSDPRQFGRVRFDVGRGEPEWWSALPPGVLDREFTAERVALFLHRRARSPIKAVLLMQEGFPGIGNWMADEILWRAGIHPRTPAGQLCPPQVARLRRETRAVARTALRTIGEGRGEPPRGWLLHVRWDEGRTCPRTGVPLVRETIGGRTTCWSPGRQKPPPRPGG